MLTKNSLPAPFLPQLDKNGIIDIAKIQEKNTLIIRLDKYVPKPYDTLVGFANNILSTPLTIPQPATFPNEIYIPFSDIPDGAYDIGYNATDFSGNIDGSSNVVQAIIKNSPSIKFPPPYFPDSVNFIVSFSSLIAESGLIVRIKYETMKKEDCISFSWSGTDAQGNYINDSKWEYTTTISVNDVAQGYKEFIVPIKYVVCLGQNGTGMGIYIVNKNTTSTPGTTMVNLEDIPYIRTHSTYGSPLSTDIISNYFPHNTVTVFSQPGKELIATIDNGLIYGNSTGGIDINSTNSEYRFTPDSFGLAQFSVLSYDKNVVNCTIGSVDGALQANLENITFYLWHDGVGAFKAYAFTTAALADGRSSCIFYILIDRDTYSGNQIVVSANGNSSIVGCYQKPTNVDILKNGVVIFNIINDNVENNIITISLPDTKDSIDIPIFFSEPKWY
ncbi:hypothetical protein GRAQ_01741 [Rahnella aquatilis CIP 78.65 = ATCC 33071]|jgi:hypothetical protein|uniref:Uncharacterized protein n=1 Tax=Rahnella aquatilis (strain ATCC 33071 / DSM 4594 / JCM 1683 / NBRC 105701 / NCIMB 13365 / CIP 78.65) TaxID=745277 RepID=H2IRN6_RAHAC|nr:hypothetical protein [Rahnella aquatilis]AEX52537.1 hypothetical protein Rahaq2_2695 [Rahnella aquatilis CIP 78.65 = ATCC 33071]KFD06616.1 hypothetical protein GRAQ_01741 [Rahnella aquatilis CIP 78.65 = ATCC 33071]